MLKRRKRFNAVIIKKSKMLNIAASVIFVVAIFFSAFGQKAFPQSFLKLALKSSVPSINASAKDSFTAEMLLHSIFNPFKVLARTIPLLNAPPYEAENDFYKAIEESYPNFRKAEKQTQLPPEIPPDALPVSNEQRVSKNLEVRNETTYAPDFNALLYAPLNFKEPEILIVHTHASESYKNDGLSYYIQGDSDRSLDTNLNVVRVGTELKRELEKFGLKVTHAQDINDYPSYNKSYTKTLGVIEDHIRRNPNIQIVIDLHRDSVVKSDGTKIKFTAKAGGETVSQIMLVCGTNQAGLENDTWQENLKFALKLQNYMENNFPGLARPLNLRQERFNMHATKGSVIIEVGTAANSLDESVAAAKYLANAINYVLKPYI